MTVVLMILLNLANGKKSQSAVPYAINAVIKEHFATLDISPQKLDFVYFGSDKEKFSKFMNQMLKIKSEGVLIRIWKFDLTGFDYQYSTFTISDSSIVFFDSVETFKSNAPIHTRIF